MTSSSEDLHFLSKEMSCLTHSFLDSLIVHCWFKSCWTSKGSQAGTQTWSSCCRCWPCEFRSCSHQRTTCTESHWHCHCWSFLSCHSHLALDCIFSQSLVDLPDLQLALVCTTAIAKFSEMSNPWHAICFCQELGVLKSKLSSNSLLAHCVTFVGITKGRQIWMTFQNLVMLWGLQVLCHWQNCCLATSNLSPEP